MAPAVLTDGESNGETDRQKYEMKNTEQVHRDVIKTKEW
jgi:hypothetical protein